ncbi:cupin domain-containing protein [Luteimonas sp. SDU101]|uniref:AraC family transcriptional regulator n=1 Tax=Luteimonas sp. SDU101 TaxID=3422593 RepID=UPI003EB82B75
MADPLSQLIDLLHPRAAFANVISGKGDWAVRFAAHGRPGFCIVLAGHCRLAVDGQVPLTLAAGDFVLLPTTPAFTLSSADAMRPVLLDPADLPSDGSEVRYGAAGDAPDMRSLGGSFEFADADPALLVSLLPTVVHVRGVARLSQLVEMVAAETVAPRPGGAAVLARLAELMLIEAMRATSGGDAPPGLLKGLGDPRLAVALQRMHARIAHRWTVDELARAASLSRSSFFERFTRTVGVAPMEYLLRWRMEIARTLLRRGELTAAQIAERVGYGSASAFSVAFRRQVGLAPGRFAGMARPPDAR